MKDIILISKRLKFRPYKIEDLPFFKTLLSDPNTMSHLTFMAHLKEGGWTDKQILDRVTSTLNRQENRTSLGFTVIDKSTDKIIGDAGLSHIHQHNKSASLGIILDHKVHANGYGVECAYVICEYAFHTMNLHRIEININASNPATSAFCQSVGLTYEGKQRDAILEDDGYKDLHQFSVLKPEWPDIKSNLEEKMKRNY